MTIPIEPGPFSFLAGAGQALGAYAEEREKKRQQQIKEATDVLHQMIDLRSKGYMPPEAFGSEQAMKVYNTLGITPPSGQATSGEIIEQGKQQYLPQIAQSLASGQPSDEARVLGGLPQRGTTEQINAGIAQNLAAVPTAQLAGAQATAQMPEAGPSELAKQHTTQDATFNEIADRAVFAAFNRSGRKRLPTSAEALAIGQNDERARAFGGRINQQYYDAAIERLRAKLSAEDIARLNAAARMAGAAGTGQDDRNRDYQRNAEIASKELDSHYKKKPIDDDYLLASMAKAARDEGRPVNRILSSAEERVEAWEKEHAALEKRLHGYQDKAGDVTGAPFGLPNPAPPPPNDKMRAASEEYNRRKQGATSAAERQRIAEDIARRFGVPLPGAAPVGRSPTGGRR